MSALPRVAMLVLNPCHSDARVLRSARALTAAGAQVRVFALGNNRFPAGLVEVEGVQVQRIVVRSVLHRVLFAVRVVYLWVRGTPARLRARHRHGSARRPVAVPATATATAAPRPRRLRRSPAARAAARARRRRRQVRLARSRVVRAHRRALRHLYLLLHRGLRRLLLPLHRPSTIRAFWAAATEAVLEWGPDVVHAHDLNTLPAARTVGARLAVPVVYDSHELWRHRNRAGLRPVARLVDLVLEHRLVPRVDAVITVSPSIAAWLERTYRLRRPVRVVRNTPERAEHVRPLDVIGRRPGERVVAYSGRFTTGRGLEDMVRALPLLPEHVVLAAVGYGHEAYVTGLRDLAAGCGVAHRVRLVDPVSPHDVAAAVAGADLALVAIEPTCLSYRFALPNKLFEAIQAGVPVVASRLPDISEVVGRYDLGEQFEPGDHVDLARAVGAVLARGAGSERARALAADELCWEVEQDELLACYRDLGVPLAARVPVARHGAVHVAPAGPVVPRPRVGDAVLAGTP